MTISWRWLGGFSVFLGHEGGSVCVDPWAPKENAPRADLVLLTNPRPGHASPEGVAAVRRPGALVAGPPDALASIPGPTLAVAPGEEFEAAGFRVRAVSAYSRHTDFFPRERGWVGYVATDGETTVWHAGATDRVPEHDGLRADIAFLPVSGRYLMGEAEARAAADAAGAHTRVALFLVGDLVRPYDGFAFSE